TSCLSAMTKTVSSSYAASSHRPVAASTRASGRNRRPTNRMGLFPGCRGAGRAAPRRCASALRLARLVDRDRLQHVERALHLIVLLGGLLVLLVAVLLLVRLCLGFRLVGLGAFVRLLLALVGVLRIGQRALEIALAARVAARRGLELALLDRDVGRHA